MRLTEYTGEKAIAAWGDLLEPIAEMASDEDVQALANTPGNTIAKVASVLIKKHPKAILKVLAVWDGEDPETYQVGFLTLPKKVIEVISYPEIRDLFTSQGQAAAASTGSATESTADDRH